MASNLGYRISCAATVRGLQVIPQLKIGWQHQYESVALPIDAQFANGAGGVFRTTGPNVGRDSFLASLGVTVRFSPKIETFLSFDGNFGSAMQAESVSGGFKINF